MCSSAESRAAEMTPSPRSIGGSPIDFGLAGGVFPAFRRQAVASATLVASTAWPTMSGAACGLRRGNPRAASTRSADASTITVSIPAARSVSTSPISRRRAWRAKSRRDGLLIGAETKTVSISLSTSRSA